MDGRCFYRLDDARRHDYRCVSRGSADAVKRPPRPAMRKALLMEVINKYPLGDGVVQTVEREMDTRSACAEHHIYNPQWEATIKRFIFLTIIVVLCPVSVGPVYAETPSSWKKAKNMADDHVYHDHPITLYCGCPFISHKDHNGSGDIGKCNFKPLEKKPKSATQVEWEHIVPASLTPARNYMCWKKPENYKACVRKNGKDIGGRNCCEKINAKAKRMIFDLHNIAPSVGQLNQYRSNDRYGEVEKDYETWGGCTARDQNGPKTDSKGEARFEPPDSVKGHVARVWLYMHKCHGVSIPNEESKMFKKWSKDDPISSWEKTRDKRINEIQGNSNPYVVGFDTCSGADCCPK